MMEEGSVVKHRIQADFLLPNRAIMDVDASIIAGAEMAIGMLLKNKCLFQA